MMKNYIEVLLIPVSLFGWLVSFCAPILGIILVQFLRIKYLGNWFTRTSLKRVDDCIQACMPEVLYSLFLAPIKRFLCNLAGVKETIENEAKEDEKLKQTMSEQ